MIFKKKLRFLCSLKRKYSKIKCILIILICVLISFKFILNKKNDFDSLINDLKQKNLKSVQLITGRFDWINWGMGDELGSKPFEMCPETRCYAFRSFVLQDANEKSDGVMVHAPNLWYMPSKKTYKRNRNQLWLFYTMESPGLSFCSMYYNMNDLDDWFNITVTFKSDSDYVADYRPFKILSDILLDKYYIIEFYRLVNLTLNQPKSSILNLNNKIKKKATVVWFVSHCETNSKREEYVKELMKYTNVDIYGNCENYFENSLGKHPCGNLKEETNNGCNDILLNSYKFYLAFENSLCDDYISEKYWKLFKPSTLFQANIVPIVRGAKNSSYTNIAPNNSLIDASEFNSPKLLADYINYLSKNDSAYLEYFNWKLDLYDQFTINNIYKNNNVKISTKDFIFNYNHGYQQRIDKQHVPFCAICTQLHNKTYLENNNNRKWIISNWFNKKTSCWDFNEEHYYIYLIAQFIGFCF